MSLEREPNMLADDPSVHFHLQVGVRIPYLPLDLRLGPLGWCSQHASARDLWLSVHPRREREGLLDFHLHPMHLGLLIPDN